jgi:hypothetical protein
MQPMRFVLAATICLLLLAGCGGGDDGDAAGTTTVATWQGVPELRPRSGTLDVEGFRAHTESVEADFETDQEALVREFLRIEDGEVTTAGPRTTLLRNNLEDDSVSAERWLLDLARERDVWVIVAARWEQRCHQNRGHQEFSPELCV